MKDRKDMSMEELGQECERLGALCVKSEEEFNRFLEDIANVYDEWHEDLTEEAVLEHLRKQHQAISLVVAAYATAQPDPVKDPLGFAQWMNRRSEAVVACRVAVGVHSG